MARSLFLILPLLTLLAVLGRLSLRAPGGNSSPASGSVPPGAEAVLQEARALPAVELRGATDLLTFGPWRWHADGRRLVATMTLRRGQVYRVAFAFYAGERLLAEEALPGNVFHTVGQTVERAVPAPTMYYADGTYTLEDLTGVSRVVVEVIPVADDVLPPGQPAWAREQAVACERAVMVACEALIAAYRHGDTYHGVAPDPALAAHVAGRMVAVGEAACRAGSSWACFLLGIAYIDGVEVPRRVARGWALVRQACDAGLAPACMWAEEQGGLR